MDVVRTLASFALLAIVLAEENVVKLDKAGQLGHSVKFPCSLPLSQPPNVLWHDFVRAPSPDRPVLIFQSEDNPTLAVNGNHPNGAHFAVDGTNFELRISNLNDDDVGTYVCVSKVENSTHNMTLRKSYYLSVYGKLSCFGQTQLMEGQNSTIACNLTYSGKAPSLKWHRGWSEVASVDLSDLTEEGLVAMQEVGVEGNYGLDGSDYRCELKFSNESQQDCSLHFNVSYPVRDITFDGQTTSRDSYYVGEEVTCLALGNPAPEISLRPTSVAGFSDGRVKQHIIIPKTWEGTEVTLECTATNTYRGQLVTLKKSVTFQVLTPTTTTKIPTTTQKYTTTTASTEPGKPAGGGNDDSSGGRFSACCWMTLPVALGLLTLGHLLPPSLRR